MNYIWGVMILTGIIFGTLNGQVDAVSDALLSSSREAVTLCITMLGVMGLWCGLMEIAGDAGLVRAVSKKIQPLMRFLFPDIPREHPAFEHITMNCVANFLGLGWAATPAGLKAMESLAELEEERRTAEEAQTLGRYRAKEGHTRKAEERHTRRTERKGQAPQMHEAIGTALQNAGPAAGLHTKHRRKKRAMPRGVASNEMCTFLILNISSLQLIPVSVIAYRAQYGSVNPTAIVGPGIAATAVSTVVAVVFCKVMDRKRRA